jgi:tRNA threonylcarbamoyladenosine biosynthesis protein TsaB
MRLVTISRMDLACILALECATAQCSVALVHAGKTWQRTVPERSQHSEAVLPLVAQVLDEAEVARSTLTHIAAGIGPGAFTGVRTAISVAQGLALGLQLPLLGIGTLEALALQVPLPRPARVASVLDARMHEVYAAVLEVDPQAGTVHTVAAPTVLSPAQLAAWLPAGVEVCIGNAFAVYGAEFTNLIMECINALPQASSVAHLALQRLGTRPAWPVQDCQPLYVRNRVALTEQERHQEQQQQRQAA